MRPSLRLAPLLAVLALGLGVSSASAQVTTGPATKVGNTDAILTGDVETNGFETTCSFIWGVNPDELTNSTDPVTFPGAPVSTSTTFSARSLETVTATITGLDRNNIYWYQLVCNDEPGVTRAFAAGELDPAVQPVDNNPNPNPNPNPPDNGTTPGNGTTAPGQGAGQGQGQGQGTSSTGNSQQQLPPLPAPKIQDHLPPQIVVSTATQRNGYVEWTVMCPATEQTCAGTVTLHTVGVFAVAAKKHKGRDKRRTLGSAKYRLKGGEAKTVRVKVNKLGRTLLRKHKDLRARATFETKDAAGNKATTSQIITLHELAFRHN